MEMKIVFILAVRNVFLSQEDTYGTNIYGTGTVIIYVIVSIK